MKYKIRKSFFETNSSSVHALCCAGEDRICSLDKLKKIPTGEFGWDSEILSSPATKASYILTLILDSGNTEDLVTLAKEISAKNKNIKLGSLQDGYVDHAGTKAEEFLPKLREIGFLNFILNDKYYFITDTDNGDMDLIQEHENFIIAQGGN